jgi:hypothetical protein
MNTVLRGVVVGTLGGVLGAFACGGGAQPGSSTEPVEMARGGQPHAEGRAPVTPAGAPAATGEMAGMPPEIQRFHDTLAPRWHAEHTPRRMADTCGASGRFHAEAAAILDAAPPKGADSPTWTAGGKRLVAAVTELDTACQAHDAAGFESAFEHVHQSFHQVMEAGGAGEPAHDHEPAAPDK